MNLANTILTTEIHKCKHDLIYFINRYLNDHIPTYQQEIFKLIDNNNHVIGLLDRGLGTDFILNAKVLHAFLFNSNENIVMLYPSTYARNDGENEFIAMLKSMPSWLLEPAYIRACNLNSIHRINFLVASPGCTKGLTASMLIANNMAYFKDGDDVLLGMLSSLAHPGAKSIFLSTKLDKNTAFKTIHDEAMAGTNPVYRGFEAMRTMLTTEVVLKHGR